MGDQSKSQWQIPAIPGERRTNTTCHANAPSPTGYWAPRITLACSSTLGTSTSSASTRRSTPYTALVAQSAAAARATLASTSSVWIADDERSRAEISVYLSLLRPGDDGRLLDRQAASSGL